MLKSFGCVLSSIDLSSFAFICLSLVPLSLILAKRLIASLKNYKKILEICLELIFSKLEVHSSVICVGRKTKNLAVYVKGNWHPLTNLWDQSSPEFSFTLFVCLSYARNRSLDRDLFSGVSSARLPLTLHAHKMDCCPGIIIYATSQYIFTYIYIWPERWWLIGWLFRFWGILIFVGYLTSNQCLNK